MRTSLTPTASTSQFGVTLRRYQLAEGSDQTLKETSLPEDTLTKASTVIGQKNKRLLPKLIGRFLPPITLSFSKLRSGFGYFEKGSSGRSRFTSVGTTAGDLENNLP